MHGTMNIKFYYYCYYCTSN